MQYSTLNKADLEEYRKRWDLVAQIEEEERRQSTVTQRLQQLNTLFKLAVAMGVYTKAIAQNALEAEIPRRRWIQLKEKFS